MASQDSALTKRKKLGYAFGIMGESPLYNMYYTYFLTFLVQILHIKPNIAGIVIFISIAWDAVTDPLLGNISDRPGSDKRKMIARSIVPLALSFLCAWSPLGNRLFGDSQAAKMVVYTVISMLIWLFYTMYTIPYYSVVAELTEDYDERTEIRSQSAFINAFCIGLGNILPALVGVAFITYIHVAGAISVITVITGFVCVASLKGVYKVRTAAPGEKVERGIGVVSTLRAFRQVARLRPVRLFLIFVFLFLAGNSMLQSNLSYMVVDCINTDYNSGIAVVIGVLVVTMAVTVPIVTKISEKTDRRTTCLIFITIAAVSIALFKFIGLDVQTGSFKIMLVLMPMMLGVGLSTFWTFFYSMSYDMVELDEFVNGANGERRESIITAFPQFVQKFGSATGILAQGVILSMYGYDAGAETGADAATFVRPAESIVKGMENVSTIIPAAILAVSLIFLVLYPITRKTYNLLTDQLKNKREGRPVSTAGLEKLL